MASTSSLRLAPYIWTLVVLMSQLQVGKLQVRTEGLEYLWPAGTDPALILSTTLSSIIVGFRSSNTSKLGPAPHSPCIWERRPSDPLSTKHEAPKKLLVLFSPQTPN